LTRLFLTLTVFLPTVLFGQTYKGQLLKDTATGKYAYYRHSLDQFIFSGKPTLIYKDKLNFKGNKDGDTTFVWLYEVTVDTVLFGIDQDAQNCKTVYILAYNYNRRTVEQSKIFLTFRPYYQTSKPGVAFSSNYKPGRGLEYYSLNAGLNISVEVINTIKEKPFNDVEIQMPSVYKKVKYRNKYEKIIIKRRKKSGCKPSSKPMLLSN